MLSLCCMQLQHKSIEAEYIHAPLAASILGLPLRSFLSYVAKGDFPSYKIGRHRLFRKTELFASMEKRRESTNSEVLR